MPYYRCENNNCLEYLIEKFLDEIYPSGRIADYESTVCPSCGKEMVKHIREIPENEVKGPYVKRGAWLKEWKLINRDSNPNNAKLNPKLD